MIDAVFAFNRRSDVANDVRAMKVSAQHNVRCHGAKAIGNGPRMQVVDVAHPRHSANRLLEQGHVQVRRGSLHQHGGRLLDQTPSAPKNQRGDEYADDSVGAIPLQSQDKNAGDDSSHGAHGVGHNVRESRAGVGVVVTARAKHEGGGDVDKQPEHGGGEHQRASNGMGLNEPADSFSHDEDGGENKSDAVDERCKHLGTTRAEGAIGGTRTLGDALGDQGKGESSRVGEHVSGVGDEGEASGEVPGGSFGEHEGQGEDEGDCEAKRRGALVVVGVAVVVVVLRRIVVVSGLGVVMVVGAGLVGQVLVVVGMMIGQGARILIYWGTGGKGRDDFGGMGEDRYTRAEEVC